MNYRYLLLNWARQLVERMAVPFCMRPQMVGFSRMRARTSVMLCPEMLGRLSSFPSRCILIKSKSCLFSSHHGSTGSGILSASASVPLWRARVEYFPFVVACREAVCSSDLSSDRLTWIDRLCSEFRMPINFYKLIFLIWVSHIFVLKLVNFSNAQPEIVIILA